MANGSAKGSSFERAICKQLSIWWTQDLDTPRDDIFWRSSGSGARATVRHRKGISTANSEGDIVFIDPLGKPLMDLLCIELKCGYGDWSIADHLETKQKKSQFWDFWRQATESAFNKNAFAALIYKKDRRNAMIAFSNKFFYLLSARINMSGLQRIILQNTMVAINVLKLDDFLEMVDPQIIKLIQKERENVQ